MEGVNDTAFVSPAIDASQTQLNLVAVGYSLGLAIPAALVAGFAPSITIMIGARIFGGVAAGMAFPTTLALITALWSGQPRTRAIALWVGTGSAISALGPMLLLWKEGAPYWPVGLGYAFVGIGVGLAGTPSSNALTGSVPVARAGMASGTADLQRDLGGAIMQSIFGALLAGGYAVHMAAAVANAPQAAGVDAKITSALEMSFSGAQTVAAQYPQYAELILGAARASFLAGDRQAYLVGIVAVLGGAALTFFFFPKHEAELDVLAQYRSEDPAFAEDGAQLQTPRELD
jgi:hypothetical protein